MHTGLEQCALHILLNEILSLLKEWKGNQKKAFSCSSNRKNCMKDVSWNVKNERNF